MPVCRSSNLSITCVRRRRISQRAHKKASNTAGSPHPGCCRKVHPSSPRGPRAFHEPIQRAITHPKDSISPTATQRAPHQAQKAAHRKLPRRGPDVCTSSTTILRTASASREQKQLDVARLLQMLSRCQKKCHGYPKDVNVVLDLKT